MCPFQGLEIDISILFRKQSRRSPVAVLEGMNIYQSMMSHGRYPDGMLTFGEGTTNPFDKCLYPISHYSGSGRYVTPHVHRDCSKGTYNQGINNP